MENIIVLDFGGQYSQLIARRVRDLRVYSELLPYDTPIEIIKSKKPSGIIFSGSPSSISSKSADVSQTLNKLKIEDPMAGKKILNAEKENLNVENKVPGAKPDTETPNAEKKISDCQQ